MSDPPRFRLGHFLIGIEGLALLRSGDSNETSRKARLDELQVILNGLDSEPFSLSRDAVAVDTVTGYGVWAETYDTPGNVTIELEQSIVWGLLAHLPVSSLVLDAGCGTGRHSVHLVELGHRVIGVDSSIEMLDRARAKLPQADFRIGELAAIPLGDESVDAAVCALALSHAESMRPGVHELGRVVRPGGRVIVSNPHPVATAYLSWRATVDLWDGHRAVIPEFPHSHSESIAAFRSAGFDVLECIEPVLSAQQAAAEAKAGLTEAFSEALEGIPVVVVWLLERR